MDVMILWPNALDLRELGSLLVVGEGVCFGQLLAHRRIMSIGMSFDLDFIGITPFLESSVVQFPCTVQRPLELLCLLFRGIQTILIRSECLHRASLSFSLAEYTPVMPG